MMCKSIKQVALITRPEIFVKLNSEVIWKTKYFSRNNENKMKPRLFFLQY